MNYLLLKLAEEAGEVVVAAIKHRIRRTARTRQRLEAEIGDVLAIIDLLIERGKLSPKRINNHQAERHDRELKRIT
jgi:phosphoribosyl-ATP pyrophosphohydrolase